MSRSEQAIFTNLCMIYDGQGRVLVEDRVDPAWPGICFPGGHVEPGESFVESVIREVWEETGLTIEKPELCGVKQFPARTGERYVVFFYKTGTYSGELHDSEEGKVFWVAKEDLKNYNMCLDFLEMIRVMESDELSEFQYYYEDGQRRMKLL